MRNQILRDFSLEDSITYFHLFHFLLTKILKELHYLAKFFPIIVQSHFCINIIQRPWATM